MQVTVVHLPAWLMERQLDKTASKLLQSHSNNVDFDFLLEKMKQFWATMRVMRQSHPFHRWQEIPAQLVVMAVGIRPIPRFLREQLSDCTAIAARRQ